MKHLKRVSQITTYPEGVFKAGLKFFLRISVCVGNATWKSFSKETSAVFKLCLVKSRPSFVCLPIKMSYFTCFWLWTAVCYDQPEDSVHLIPRQTLFAVFKKKWWWAPGQKNSNECSLSQLRPIGRPRHFGSAVTSAAQSLQLVVTLLEALSCKRTLGGSFGFDRVSASHAEIFTHPDRGPRRWGEPETQLTYSSVEV